MIQQLNIMKVDGYGKSYGELLQEIAELRSKGVEQAEDLPKLLKFKEIAEISTPEGEAVTMYQTAVDTLRSMIQPLPPMQ